LAHFNNRVRTTATILSSLKHCPGIPYKYLEKPIDFVMEFKKESSITGDTMSTIYPYCVYPY
jgi:hypothetical protein